MEIIVLIGAVFMLVKGGLFQCLLYLCIVAWFSNKFTDSNRRGRWWK